MRRFLMGLLTGGVVSAAALGLLSQMMLRGDRPTASGSEMATSVNEEETSSAVSSGALVLDQDDITSTSEIDANDGASEDVGSTNTDEAVTDAGAVSVERSDSGTATDTGSATEADSPSTQAASEEDMAEAPAALETADTQSGAEDGTDPDQSSIEAAQAEAPTGETVNETADAPQAVEDPTANAPVPDVSQSAPAAPQPQSSTVAAPKVVDRDTGETVDVTATLRSATSDAPDVPSAERQVAVSTTPAVRPTIQPAQNDISDADATDETATAEAAMPQTEANESDTDGAMTAPATENANSATLTPTIGNGGGDLKSLAPEIKINRLPTLGTTSAGEDETESGNTQAETAEAPAPDLSGLPVLERYATAFDIPEDKPLMSIILMDQGASLDGSEVGVEALSQFAHPVTLAVDSRLPDAADRVARYRAAGFEVMAMVDMPAGFTAQDTEVSMSVILDDLPEVIGVLEGVETGLQTDRAVARQVASILSQTGHGLITQDKGLNSGVQFAERAGVPVQSVFRDIDNKDQTATVIRRFLDNAAFRAGQEEGGIVMLGRIRPDTISALLLWGLQDRAQRVAIAPASAILLNR